MDPRGSQRYLFAPRPCELSASCQRLHPGHPREAFGDGRRALVRRQVLRAPRTEGFHVKVCQGRRSLLRERERRKRKRKTRGRRKEGEREREQIWVKGCETRKRWYLLYVQYVVHPWSKALRGSPTWMLFPSHNRCS